LIDRSLLLEGLENMQMAAIKTLEIGTGGFQPPHRGQTADKAVGNGPSVFDSLLGSEKRRWR